MKVCKHFSGSEKASKVVKEVEMEPMEEAHGLVILESECCRYSQLLLLTVAIQLSIMHSR